MSTFTSDDRNRNESDNESLDAIVERYLSRRSVLKGGLGAAVAMIAGAGLGDCFAASAVTPAAAPSLALGFESIPGSRTDAIVIANGYRAQLLAPWGTPLNAQAKPWRSDGGNGAVDQANAAGMHHDGMHFFPLDGSSSDGLLAINYEYIDQQALHPAGPTTRDGKRPVEEVRKEINAHGAAVIRIRRIAGTWQVVDHDPLNRRFTSATPMEIAGPLRGHASLVTPFSPDGTRTRGTNNNCGNGFTPWGTYLTCEENWPGIFISRGPLPVDQKRIGITDKSSYGWETAAGDTSEVADEFRRFDLTPTGATPLQDYRNEASGYGYIVEIDPYDSATPATKRTALGRFRHEGAAYGIPVAGQPLSFYMGDDSRNEYIYRFVSAAPWDPADTTPAKRLAAGAKYLDHGTLYVARFDADGTGAWLPLTVDSPTQDGRTLGALYGDLAGIILNTRGAADAVGATPMDRPEWTTVNPFTGDVYVTLTNNTRTTPNAANPRGPNPNGHIVRWKDQPHSTAFTWDIFVFGANAGAAPDVNRSGLSELNQFASPDGLAFDSRGILWIETDNSGNAVAEYTNDQLLAVIPAQVVDATGKQVALSATNQASLRRFLVGPNGCEITGITWTPDLTTMFVNVQHPDNWPYRDDATVAAPAGTKVRPRAATVAIQKLDGGPIGV